jgi:hypothetical protein
VRWGRFIKVPGSAHTWVDGSIKQKWEESGKKEHGEPGKPALRHFDSPCSLAPRDTRKLGLHPATNSNRNKQFRQGRKGLFDAPRAIAGDPRAFGPRHFPAVRMRPDPSPPRKASPKAQNRLPRVGSQPPGDTSVRVLPHKPSSPVTKGSVEYESAGC